MTVTKHLWLGLLFLTSLSFATSSRTPTDKHDPLAYPNYVVIGAFSIQNNATNFAQQAANGGHNAKVDMNMNRNLYYVYVMVTNDHTQAILEALRLRKETAYHDAWVYNGVLGKEVKGTDITPVTEKPIETIPVTETKEEPPVVTEEKTPEVVAQQTEPEGDKDGKVFFFKIYRATNQEKVQAEVDVIDVDRTRKVGSYAGNKQVRVTSPDSKSGNISLICQAFGYRKVQVDMNYNVPTGEGVQINEAFIEVPFELNRLRKGDKAIMYNVFFFNDAAVMRPESRFEVQSLLAMLQENPKIKIKIHGHTNGSAPGKIISVAEGSDKYFSLDETNKEGFGTAKDLSQARAEMIKNFLISNGIAKDRMQTKGWGGKEPLYDKDSQRASSNVRVEIEILAE